MCVNDNTNFYKVCLVLLNDIVESQAEHNCDYVNLKSYYTPLFVTFFGKIERVLF